MKGFTFDLLPALWKRVTVRCISGTQAGPYWRVLCLLLVFLFCHSLYGQTVYITRTGEKYHEDGCRSLSKSKIETTLLKAKNEGYTPCSICKPIKSDTTYQQGAVANPKPPTQTTNASSTQCTARTKSNTRCSRKTTNANGRCWQHQ